MLDGPHPLTGLQPVDPGWCGSMACLGNPLPPSQPCAPINDRDRHGCPCPGGGGCADRERRRAHGVGARSAQPGLVEWVAGELVTEEPTTHDADPPARCWFSRSWRRQAGSEEGSRRRAEGDQTPHICTEWRPVNHSPVSPDFRYVPSHPTGLTTTSTRHEWPESLGRD